MDKFDRGSLSALQGRAGRYHQNLLEDAGAIPWLAARGIPEWVAREYLLGVCDDIYPGRLAIPYLREPHGVIWFNYRALDGSDPKYRASGARHLYNTAALELADVSGDIAVCEGELDALVATSLCGVPAVGVPGATQWQGNKKWHELFRGYQRVWVLADPDEAGKGMAEAIMETLPRARVVKLPADVNETYLRHGEIRSFFP